MSCAIRHVLIAGGGPVGSVLALALSRSGIDVTLVDTVPLGVDTAADLERARAILATRPSRGCGE